MPRNRRALAIAAVALLIVPAFAHAFDADAELESLFEAEWDRDMEESPTWASQLGDRRFHRQWPDLRKAAIDRQHARRQATLKALDKIDVDALSPANRLNYRLFRQRYELDVEAFQYGWHLVPLTQRGGIQDANSLADSLPFLEVRDFEDWLERIRRLPEYLDQTQAVMREGIKRGVIHPKIVMRRVPQQIRRQIVDDPQRSPFFKPFRNYPDDISKADRLRLTKEATALIKDGVIPGYQAFLKFIEGEYLPACFDRVGVSQIPNGQSFYTLRARRYTTTSLTPREIHEIGLLEVQRIRSEMQEIIDGLEFEGSFADFLEHLRTDPKFYFKDANDLLAAYREVSKRIDPKLVRLFRRLPRIPYGVEPIPAQLAPDTTTAYYRPPAADGSRAGTYFVNLYRPEVRPKYEIEALSLHEAVPGHHLQIALAMELENVPQFRRMGGYTAFIEGWGLYSESLGEDLGLYKDPYSKFGQLTYEMWRAVRLVVDTGMHSLEWERQRAIDFFADNAAKTLHDIENEIDRYIAWPGQALAYKVGELKIQELRLRAEKELGDKFDVRDFHEAVLENGAIPLDVLESHIVAWIEKVKSER